MRLHRLAPIIGTTVLLTSLAVVPAAGSSNATGAWEPPQQLTEVPTYTFGPIVFTRNGTSVMQFQLRSRSRCPETGSAIRRPGEGDWTVLPDPIRADPTDEFLVSKNRVLSTWLSCHSRSVDYRRLHDTGWGDVHKLDFPDHVWADVPMTMNDHGDLAITWRGPDESPGVQGRIKVRGEPWADFPPLSLPWAIPVGARLTNGGDLVVLAMVGDISADEFAVATLHDGAWAIEPLAITPGAEVVGDPKVASSPNGAMVVGWREDQGATRQVVLQVRGPDGVLDSPYVLSDESFCDESLAVCADWDVDRAGNVVATWRDGPDGEAVLRIVRRDVGTGLWSERPPVSIEVRSEDDRTLPQLDVADDGTAVLRRATSQGDGEFFTCGGDGNCARAPDHPAPWWGVFAAGPDGSAATMYQRNRRGCIHCKPALAGYLPPS